LQKDGCHFGSSPKFFDGHAFFKGLHRQHVCLCTRASVQGMGSGPPPPFLPSKRSQGVKYSNPGVERETLPRTSCRKASSLRFLSSRVGGSRYKEWQPGTRILEGSRWASHQCEGTSSCNQHCPVPGQERRAGTFVRGQFGELCLPEQGGSTTPFQFLMRSFLRWCMSHRVQLKVSLVKSENQLADSLSRLEIDPGDYTLDRNLFWEIKNIFHQFIRPQIDMFASPGNAQLTNFIARHPHWQAVGVDALKCPLEGVGDCYANPPWTLILQWLCRLQQNPQVRCLLVAPYWVSATWWPLLVKLHCPGTLALLVPPYQGMFRDCQGRSMNAPRWPLLCIMLSGQHYRANKFRLKTSTLF
jgi:hypothetical protein